SFFFSGHTDYVRCGMISPSSSDIWISGSYDHTIKVWDMRIHKEVISIPLVHSDNSSLQLPVEAIAVYPSGTLLAAAGGNQVQIFDLATGGRLLHTMSN